LVCLLFSAETDGPRLSESAIATMCEAAGGS